HSYFFLSFLFFLSCSRPLPHLHSFPTRRSSDLSTTCGSICSPSIFCPSLMMPSMPMHFCSLFRLNRLAKKLFFSSPSAPLSCTPDRKSTRLNSSHVKISYAVFCLKKKNKKKIKY